MAMDNLNYYSAWLPAWQLTDKYSSQPWCLKSKNLDIFSSSKSVKATAWTAPIQWGSDVIKQDGKLVLKTDGKVYERWDNGDTLVVDPSTNFPVYKVNYDWTSYADAQWWTPQDLVAKYDGDELKSFVVFTDRASYTRNSVKYVLDKPVTEANNLTFYQNYDYHDFHPAGKSYKQTAAESDATLHITPQNPPFASFPITIYANESAVDDTTIAIQSIRIKEQRYTYDWELDAMVASETGQRIDVPYTWNFADWIKATIPAIPSAWVKYNVQIRFEFNKKEGAATWWWEHWKLFIDYNGACATDYKMYIDGGTYSDWDYNEYYTYLPLKDRKLDDIGEYYRMKWANFQTFYNWQWSWASVNWFKKIRYDFEQYMGWNNDTSMDVVGMVSRNEQVYMIGNMDGNGYIFPCDLTWGRGTPYIAYGCEFKWVANIDYLMYLVWEDRGISKLWVYNGQELVPILWGNEESDQKNIVEADEQYRFDWKMVEYRGNLILSTTDWRIFQYGQTYGGKWGAFIHELPTGAVVTDLKADGKDLVVDYSITTTSGWVDTVTKYTITYIDDKPIKRYNIEWTAEYPMVIGNHLLEKEESDLYASFILPSSDCSLEFRWMANHYHFWTFISSDDVTIDPTGTYKIAWATWNYELKFIERNDDQYTFRLEGDLPVQTTSTMKITDGEGVDVITYTEYNHFRKIWEITTDGYQEWEFRFHNLNNKLELPKSHTLQILVKGKGTTSYTPELFALDLVANQRDRW